MPFGTTPGILGSGAPIVRGRGITAGTEAGMVAGTTPGIAPHTTGVGTHGIIPATITGMADGTDTLVTTTSLGITARCLIVHRTVVAGADAEMLPMPTTE